jgi:hypothetical protein
LSSAFGSLACFAFDDLVLMASIWGLRGDEALSIRSIAGTYCFAVSRWLTIVEVGDRCSTG